MLTKRQVIILMSIVDEYLKEMTPISSKQLIIKCNLKVSSATIRNEMAKLEQLEYLLKPHTSSGRVPSDKALRFYVDELSQNIGNDYTHNFTLETKLSELQADEIAHYISKESNYLTSVSISSEDEKVVQVHFTTINESLTICVIVLESGNIEHVQLATNGITRETLETVTNVLNYHIKFQPLSKVPHLVVNIRLNDGDGQELLNQFIRNIEHITVRKKERHFAGFDHLIEHMKEDFLTLQQLYFDMEQKQLDDLIDTTANGVKVYFGDEIKNDYQAISVITTNFKINNQYGDIMIIGPRFMGYKEAIELLYGLYSTSSIRSD